MKLLLVIILAIFSCSTLASISLKIDLNIAEAKTTIDRKIELDKRYSEILKNGRMEYILSSKKPSNFPTDYLWEENSIHLKVEIFDSKGTLISSPDVTTVLGKTATVEQFESKNATRPSLKMNFTATKLWPLK